MTAAATNEEIQIVRMAKQFRGEVFASGATVLSNLAARMAKLVYDDDIVLFGGGSFGAWDCAPLPLLEDEEYLARATAQGQLSWDVVFDLMAADRFRIFAGPVQIDRSGSANISVVGDWHRPDVALIGSRGLPDDMWRISEIYFHVPRHTSRTLVEKVDFVSSLGFGDARDGLGCRTGYPSLLVTDLGVFAWRRSTGELEVESLHPGVTADQVRASTGFEIEIPANVPVTELPTSDELDAIRRVLDPWGFRAGSDEDARRKSRLVAQAVMPDGFKARRNDK